MRTTHHSGDIQAAPDAIRRVLTDTGFHAMNDALLGRVQDVGAGA